MSMWKALVVGLALQGAAGVAQAAVYDCTFMNMRGAEGWITEHYVIRHDKGSGRATVVDGFIEAVSGGPIPVQSVEETKGKLVFTWQAMAMDPQGQSVPMLYRAAWFKGEGYMRIVARRQGSSDVYEAVGNCRVG